MKKSLFILIGVLTSLTIQAQDNIYEDIATGLKYQYYLDVNDNNAPKAKLVDGKSTTATKVDFILQEFEAPNLEDHSATSTYKVTSIGKNAFSSFEKNKYIGNSSIEYVIIPKGVTTIEENAFNNCSNINLLELPSTIRTVATNAFTGCTRLVYVCSKNPIANSSIPSALPNNELMTLFVPDRSANDGEDGYLNSTYNWDAKFGDRIYEGGMDIIHSTTYNMDFVCAIGDDTRQATLYKYKGENIDNIIVPYSIVGDNSKNYHVVSIGRSAFYGRSEIKNVVVDEGVSTISNMAFQKCSNLQKLTLPSSLKTIGTSAFADCNNIKHVWCKVADPKILDATKFPNKGMMTLYVSSVSDYMDTEKGKWKTQFNGRILAGDMVSITADNGIEYVGAKGSEEATLNIGIPSDDPFIPETIEKDGVTYRVTGIDRGAFSGFSDITKLIIPANVNAIGSNAFNGCSKLTIVHCKSASPYDIADNVFSSKTKATLFIPSSVSYENISGWNFSDVERCNTMERFTYEGMDFVGWQLGTDMNAKLIKGKPSITSIPLEVNSAYVNGYKVVYIGESAFSGIKSLDNLDLASSNIERIEANAFKNCTDLKSRYLPSVLKDIGANAFSGCTGLTIVTLPSNLKSIGNKAFSGCGNLVEVECKTSSVVNITEKNVFSDEDMILYIPSISSESDYKGKGWNFLHFYLGDRLYYQDENNVNTYVYGSADNTNSVILLSSTKNDATVTVSSTVNINSIKKNVTAIAKYAFLNKSSINTLTIESGIKYIDKYAFKGCGGLKKVELPSSLIAIRDYAFDGCSKISIINSGIDNPFEIKEHVFSASISPTIFIPKTSLNAYQTQKGWERFLNNYRLGAAELKEDPNHQGIFYDCYTYEKTATLAKISGVIQTIDVPEKVAIGGIEYTVTDIGESLYKENSANKSSLTKLTISKGIRSIKDNAFQGCSSLATIIWPDSLTTIGSSAFEGTKIGSVTLPKKVNAIGPFAFKGCSSLKNIILSDSLKSIEGYAFQNASQLETIEVPVKVDSIGMYAFSGCSQLKTVTFSDSLKYIGEYAFSGCSSLTKLVFKDKVKNIGMSAFNGCTNLNWIDFPSKLEKIEQFAFQNCKNLTTIISRMEKDNVVDIEDNVFRFVDKNNISNESYELYQKATLFVPMPADTNDAYKNVMVDEYRAKNGWKKFVTIIGGEKKITPQPVNNIIYEYLTGPKKATVIGASFPSGELVINGTEIIDGAVYKVDSIGVSAIEKNTDKTNLIKLTVSKGIRSIGANAFKGCSKLAVISLPDSLTTIGQSAFEGNTALTNLTIPEGVKTIGLSAFNGCTNLIRVVIPSTVISIGESAFAASSNITSITSRIDKEHLKAIPDNPNYVFHSTVYNNAKLFVPMIEGNDTYNNDTRNKYHTTAGWDGFNIDNIILGEKGLITKENITYEYLTGPKTATVVEILIPAEQKELTILGKVGIDNKAYDVKVINPSVFANNDQIVTLNIGDGIETIGENAFNGCKGLQKIWLPKTLKSDALGSGIGSKAFYGCTSLSRVCIETSTLPIISTDVFPNSIAYLFAPNATTVSGAGWNTFSKVEKSFYDGDITSEGITFICMHNGEGQSITRTAILHNSTTTPSAIPTSAIFEGDTYTVTTIDKSAFSSKAFEYLVIPEGIVKVGANAFMSCTKLKELIIPQSLAADGAIGESAFDGCDNITTIISRIDKNHLNYSIPNNTFTSTVFNNATLFVPMAENDNPFDNATINAYKGQEGWKNFIHFTGGEKKKSDPINSIIYEYLTGPKTATVIEILASEDQKELTIPKEVEIDSKKYDVKDIKPSVFSNKAKIETLIIENGVERIGENAFKDCSALQKVWLPSSLSSTDGIGSKAFNNCKSLKRVCIEATVLPTIDENVFPANIAYLFVHEGTSVNDKLGWSSFKHPVEGYYDGDITSSEGISYICSHTGEGENTKRTAILIGSTSTPSTINTSVALDNNTYTVTTIGESAFSSKAFETLEIPEEIVTIEANAFSKCSKLKELILPSKLAFIGENAFDQCTGITTIISRIPKNKIFNINDNVFTSIYATATLFVPIDVDAEDAFDNDTRNAYKGKTGWKEFSTIIGGEKKKSQRLGNFVYDYLTGPKTATVTEIYLSGTETNLSIPKTVEIGGKNYAIITIAPTVFENKDKFKTLSIADNIKTIASKAFNGCKSLARVSIRAATLPSIDSETFPVNIAYLFVHEGIKVTDQTGWSSFAKVVEGEYVNDMTSTGGFSYICYKTVVGESTKMNSILTKYSGSSNDVEIPSTVVLGNDTYDVTTIAKTAFNGNTKLESVLMPKSIATIDNDAFAGCSNLRIIESKVETPIDINNRNVFSDYSASLYIPSDNADTYRSKGWDFLNIFVGDKGVHQDTESGLTYNYATIDKKAILVKASSTDKDYTIPGTFKKDDATYTVTAIGKNVFKDNKKIVNLTISENIVNIGASTFQNCTSLKKVELPSTLDKIGDNAFDGCTSIAYVSSKNAKSIALGNSAFSTSINETARLFVHEGSISEYSAWKGYFANILEGELKVVVDGDMTYYCVAGPNTATLVEAKTTDAEVTISNEVKYDNVTYIVTEIGDYAFSGISSLQKVVIGDSITTIGIGAFRNCSKLKEVVIPAGVTAIGDKAFEKCDRLTLVVSHIKDPTNINMGDDVFPQVSAKLNVPDGTKELYEKAKGWNVFSTILQGDMKEAEVDGMTYQYVTGDKVATLMKGATKEKVLTIPTSVTIDGTPYEIKTINESALANISTIESLYISEGIDSIADNAFRNCANLNKVSLPATLRKLGDNAFSKCDKLVHIETAIKTPISISENVFAETTYANATLYVPVGTSAQYAAAEVWKKFASKMLEGDLNEVTVEGMTYICVPNLKIAKLIKGPDKTKDVKIPSKIYTGGKSYYVVDIERSAFYGFSTLEKVIIPDSVKTIGMEAFKNCSKLNTVELPSTLQSIGEKAFENCSKLTLVVCASETPATIFENTFPANAITINVPLGAKDAYQSANYWGSDNFTIYDSMSSLSEGDETKEEAPATYQIITDDDSSTTSVAIVDDVNVSGDFAIPEAVVHNGMEYPVTAIAPNTFENNMSLISVTIPSSINSIGESAFAGCSNLKSIIVNWTEPLDLSAPAATRGLMTRSGGSSVFEGVDKDNCVLYVPDGSVDAYKAAEVWKDFKNIKPISTAAIRDLIINGMPFDVYDLQGRKVRQNVTTLKGLPSGIYIVNGKKVSVRR